MKVLIACEYSGRVRRAFAALGHDFVRGTLAYSHATAHHNAVHEGQVRFGVMVNQVVEGVLFCEEVFQCRIAGEHGLVKKSDVTASTKMAKGPVLISAPNRHSLNLRVMLPTQQGGGQGTHHGQGQGVERFRASQGQHAHVATNFGNYFGTAKRNHGESIRVGKGCIVTANLAL